MNNKKDINFSVIDNADMNEIEKIAEQIAPADEKKKKKILEASRRKYNNMKNNNEHIHDDEYANGETVSGTELYHRPKILRFFTGIAACGVLALSVAGSAMLIRNSSQSSPSASEINDKSQSTSDTVYTPIDESQSDSNVFIRLANTVTGEEVTFLSSDNIIGAKVIENNEPVDITEESSAGNAGYLLTLVFDEYGTKMLRLVSATAESNNEYIYIWLTEGDGTQVNISNTMPISDGVLITPFFNKDDADYICDLIHHDIQGYGDTDDESEYEFSDGSGQITDENIKKAISNNTNMIVSEAGDFFLNEEVWGENVKKGVPKISRELVDLNGDDIPEIFVNYSKVYNVDDMEYSHDDFIKIFIYDTDTSEYHTANIESGRPEAAGTSAYFLPEKHLMGILNVHGETANHLYYVDEKGNFIPYEDILENLSEDERRIYNDSERVFTADDFEDISHNFYEIPWIDSIPQTIFVG